MNNYLINSHNIWTFKKLFVSLQQIYVKQTIKDYEKIKFMDACHYPDNLWHNDAIDILFRIR